MPSASDLPLAEAAKKATELRLAAEAQQWELMRLALEKGLATGLSPSQAMPRVELFPVARQPR
jgi:hypothetical protein